MGTINFFPKPLSLSSTASSSLTKTVNGSHEFTIKGYSLNKGMGIGKHIASDTFKVGGYTWAVCFFPDGKCLEDNSVYVSLFVSLACDARDVRALFELSLVDQSGKGRDKVYSHFGKVLETGPYTLKSVGSMWGYKRFYKRTALEISDYIKDDCLLIRCTVGVVNSISAPKVHTKSLPPSDMGQCFGSLLESGQGADVKFEVDGEIFSAHKLVLATRSPVFKAQLYGPLKDGEKECIKVMEIEAPVFKALLHFIYWDIFPDNQVLLSPTWASNLMTRHLLAAADRYGIDRLRVICEAKLCDDIAVNNVATTLALAEQHQCIHLKAVCLRFIALSENLRAVMATDGFKYLKDSCPTVLSELLKLVARLGQYSTISLDGIKDEYVLDGIKIEDALDDGTDINGRRVKQRID